MAMGLPPYSKKVNNLIIAIILLLDLISLPTQCQSLGEKKN